MNTWCSLWLCGFALVVGQAHGSVLRSGDGKLVLEWITDSTFRFCRDWGAGCSESGARTNKLEIVCAESSERLECTSKYLKVEVEKEGFRVRVQNLKEKLLMEDVAGLVRNEEGIAATRAVSEGERFYGLGPRTDPGVDSRGKVIEAFEPFLVSSSGYGTHHPDGNYQFDLAHSRPDRYRVLRRNGSWFEYYFYYGPSPKQVLEEHREVTGPTAELRRWQLLVLHPQQVPEAATTIAAPREASWDSLGSAVRWLVHGAFSGVLYPALDIAPYTAVPLPLFRRALQLAAVTPVVYNSELIPLEEKKLDAFTELAKQRRQLTPYLLSYVKEAATRGLPLVRPLAMQFTRDAESASVDDQFMLGDEILVAPVCGPGGKRQVYLPMGFWTDLKTNEMHTGRQRIDIEANGLPMFVRNGSIVPLGADGSEPMALHYFPKLAAEFFLHELEGADYTQLHAGPAVDLMRLEIESKRTRVYEWVVHHHAKPRNVTTGGEVYPEVKTLAALEPGRWWFDQKAANVHVRVWAEKDRAVVTYLE